MSDPKDSKRTTRQKAADARAEALAAEKRRENTVRIVGAIAVLAVVAGIILIAVFASRGSETPEPTASSSIDPAAALPTGAFAAGTDLAFGVPYGKPKAGAPVLQLWEDFQCPACAQVEATNGAGIEQLAEEGKIQLVWRSTSFLDRQLKNDASLRAAAAWGCAVDAGKAREYHNVVFANQPATEGEGYTDQQLIDFAGMAGIKDAALQTFTTCFNERKYLGWAQNSTQVFYDSGIPGTPSALLNGKTLANSVLVDQAALEQAVAEATS